RRPPRSTLFPYTTLGQDHQVPAVLHEASASEGRPDVKDADYREARGRSGVNALVNRHFPLAGDEHKVVIRPTSAVDRPSGSRHYPPTHVKERPDWELEHLPLHRV